MELDPDSTLHLGESQIIEQIATKVDQNGQILIKLNLDKNV